MLTQETLRLIASGLLLLMCTTYPAQAQYFYDTAQQPAVQVDLSVLEDRQASPPITLAAPAIAVEQVALPTSAPVASTVSPYERARVVTRIELEGANPYLGKSAVSPFTPPALIKPPAAAPEAPRTTPAAIITPQPATDGPMIVDGASDGDITLK